jgi:hypothetical protein
MDHNPLRIRHLRSVTPVSVDFSRALDRATISSPEHGSFPYFTYLTKAVDQLRQ